MNCNHAVIVSPNEGVFSATCEVHDTADPDVKVFRFKEWPGNGAGIRGGQPVGHLRFIAVYSAPVWMPDSETFDPGECLGDYRITDTLDALPGYVGVFEGTTKTDEVREPEPEAEDERSLKIDRAILGALGLVPRMRRRDLQRKTHASRYVEWESRLQKLQADGVLTIVEEVGRVWVALAP